jgi:hypothetical protein
VGLIGGMARTAVVAGTATAVSNRVSRRQANRWAARDQSTYAEPQYAQPQYAQPQYAQPQYAQPQYAPASAPPVSPVPASASSGSDDLIARLRQLADLRNQGVLNDQEFSSQVVRILAS